LKNSRNDLRYLNEAQVPGIDVLKFWIFSRHYSSHQLLCEVREILLLFLFVYTIQLEIGTKAKTAYGTLF